MDTSTTGGTQTAAAGSLSLTVRNAAGTEVTAVGSTDQGRAVATVTDGSNRPVAGAIVVFSQADASLVTFAPEAGTALTDANGQATIDFKATNTTKTGAVSVVAQVLVGTTTLTAKKAIQITGTAAAVEVPTSMLFLDASPASIVIKGAGGSGRSESSTLRFKVVNAASTPIRGAVVNFAVSNPGVTLNIPSATSDAEGVVVTTVTSGTQPLSVVVTATAAANATATVPSSALSVSNGLTVAGGLEIVAAKYNIDGGVTGTETDVSAFLRDVNGNLVPDGTITSFTTDFGAVGSSSAGACSTVNGTCKVKFRVQEPRGTGVATVRATVQLPGNAVPLVDTIAINMANSGGARALSNTDPVTVATTLTLAGTCKDTFALFSADNFNRPLAAGTVVTAVGAGKSVAVSIASGSPVEDSLSGVPTSLRVAVDATAASPACAAAGGAQETTTFELKFTSPGGVSSSVPLTIRYPR
ncbi:MAG TPA: hypothetical protein VEA40_01925 [Ramlibacter sp.]|nr:hypothetical protein [Ramlibacter sp.]